MTLILACVLVGPTAFASGEHTKSQDVAQPKAAVWRCVISVDHQYRPVAGAEVTLVHCGGRLVNKYIGHTASNGKTMGHFFNCGSSVSIKAVKGSMSAFIGVAKGACPISITIK